jgi:hypothetical protein
MSKWRVDRWGATEQRIIAIGPEFSEEPKISVRAIRGSEITPVCDITQELEYPHLYPQIGYPNTICMKEDDGFYVLEAASMKILEYSPQGKLVRRSTEVPEGFVPPLGGHELQENRGHVSRTCEFHYASFHWPNRQVPSGVLAGAEGTQHLSRGIRREFTPTSYRNQSTRRRF